MASRPVSTDTGAGTPAGSAPHPPSGVGCSPVAIGDRLAGRYRLVAPLPGSSGGSAVLWYAVDEVLARPVAVTVLPASSATGGAARFLAAASRTGAVLAPGLARTYDAALEERPDGGGAARVAAAYVISEWVEGRSLPQVLREGPLAPSEAVGLVLQAADALAAVHEAGLTHGRVTPANLLLTPAGRLRLTGTLVAAVLHGQPPGDGPAGVLEDTRGLAAVLYALLTEHWPGPADRSGGLPLPPAVSGRLPSPRQVRGGVPRALDLLVLATLDPARAPGVVPAATPQDLAARAARAVRAGNRAAVLGRPAPRWVLRTLPWLASLALLGAVGVTGYRLGLSVGGLEPADDPGQLLARPVTSPAAAGVLDLGAPGVTVLALEPIGGNARPGTAPLAHDGSRRTAWRTRSYGTASGPDGGVGLLLDLGRRTSLARVDVDASAPGARYALRAGNDLSRGPGALVAVAQADRAGRQTQLVPRASARGRYWLLQVTRLPPDAGGYRLGVEELRLVQR